MRNRFAVVLLGAGFLAAHGAVFAGGGGGADSAGAFVRITSEPEGLRVFRDTTFLGTTPFGSGPLPGGVFRFTVFGADPAEWFSPPVSGSILLSPGDTVERHVVLPRVVRITSEPSGADVRLGDSLLGTTPVYAPLPRGPVTLTLSRRSFADLQALVPAGLGGYHAVMTPAGAGPAGIGGPLTVVEDDFTTPVIIAVSVAVVSGAASAYLKSRADAYYDDYRATREGSTLDRVRHFDLLSGITLGVTELSLGYLIVELLSR